MSDEQYDEARVLREVMWSIADRGIAFQGSDLTNRHLARIEVVLRQILERLAVK